MFTTSPNRGYTKPTISAVLGVAYFATTSGRVTVFGSVLAFSVVSVSSDYSRVEYRRATPVNRGLGQITVPSRSKVVPELNGKSWCGTCPVVISPGMVRLGYV